MNGPTNPTPTVGQAATQRVFNDSYGYVVVKVSPSGKKVWLAKLRPVNASTGHEPARFEGGLPVWQHTYTADELVSLRVEDAKPEVAIRQGNGAYRGYGCSYSFGEARYYCNLAAS